MTTQVLASSHLEFPRGEYIRRLDATQHLMREEELGALLISQTENVFYYTGFRCWLQISKHRPMVTIVPSSGEPILFVPRNEKYDAVAFSWIEDIRDWDDGDDYVALYLAAIKELGVSHASIGLELGDDTNMAMPILQYERLKTSLPRARFVDCSEIIWGVRSVKSDPEIDRMRTAAVSTGSAILAAWESLRPGMTERDLHRSIAMGMLAEGLEMPLFITVQSGDDFMNSMADKFATGRTIQQGDMLMVDVGAMYRGYSSDMVRMASVGHPPSMRETVYQVCVDLNHACCEAVQAGIRITDVALARQAFLDSLSPKIASMVTKPTWVGIGHSIGLTTHELPRIGGPGLHTRGSLKAGMVITIEPGIKSIDGEKFHIENMLVVKEGGYENMTTASDQMKIIEW
jgi:Xaa-Pro dipeptidase